MNSKVIFVVDDEAVIADTLSVILQHAGFVARPFHRPEDALRASESIVPDLLISDVFMPGMTGVELANRVRAQSPECRIFLFSGQQNARSVLEKEQGKFEFTINEKPIHPSELLALIHESL
ncbi:response regulator [Terracidiphilus sp.]|jgi:DNA-binding NtrC family response regulator|uniref:response regulator n=1 Tax=Terracidiphilus sp. TaxID=1964191 RepID=UPI003C24F260